MRPSSRFTLSDSGSLNKKGRNNTSGGILLEEGTADFTVQNCVVENIRGNGVWTHSRKGPREMREADYRQSISNESAAMRFRSATPQR